MVMVQRTSGTLCVKSLAPCLEQKRLSKMAVAVSLTHVIFKNIY